MADNNHPLAILRNAKIYSIHQTQFDNVIQGAQRNQYLFKVVAVAVKNSADIFKHPNFRLNLFNG